MVKSNTECQTIPNWLNQARKTVTTLKRDE